MDKTDPVVRNVKTRGGFWKIDIHLLIALFFIGTGVGIPLGVAMLCWRAWCVFKENQWTPRPEPTRQGDLNTSTAWSAR